MTIAEAKKQYTPAQVKTMIAKAKVSKDDNPYTSEEWLAKAEYSNRGRPKKEAVKVDEWVRQGALN